MEEVRKEGKEQVRQVKSNLDTKLAQLDEAPHPLDGTLPEDHFNNFPEEDFQTEADGVVPVALDEGLWAQVMDTKGPQHFHSETRNF